LEKAILLVIPTLETGGAQTFLVRLATHLNRDTQVHVYVIHPGSADTANEEKLAHEGIKKLYRRPSAALFNWLQSRNWNGLKKLITRIESRTGVLAARDRRHLHRLIRSKGIGLVNSHMYLADSYCCQMLNTHPVPIVTTLHGCYNLIIEEIAQGKYDAAYIAEFTTDAQRVTRRLNGIIYLTDRQLSAVPVLLDAPIPKKKIYNGFRSASENPRTATTGVKTDWHFGMVARGIASKGWEELILAYQQVKASNPSKKIRLSLAGDSEFLQQLQKKYPDPDILFHGRVADPLPLMQQWDVGALPTYFDAESLPNSVIEYLFAGLPVIATDLAEIPNMIDSEGSRPAGLLVPLQQAGKPDPNIIAKAMQRYIDDQALWEEHRRNASLAYKKFDIDVCVASYRNFFEQVKPPTAL
jgi:glycosyltransferase involved in cell wall biosynthesis